MTEHDATESPLAGKKVVVTAGAPREDIDGVRAYANRLRPATQGYALAAKLAAGGADVTVIAPSVDTSFFTETPHLHRLISERRIVTGQDLMEETTSYVVKNPCDAVFCMASLASIRPAVRAGHKLKVKNKEGDAINLTVIGNVAVETYARRWHRPVIGFNAHQEAFGLGGIPSWLPEGWTEPEAIAGAEKKEPPQRPNSYELKGKKILVTLGPTEEPITTTSDVITNFSTGRQGLEIVRALLAKGADVVAVAGPISLPLPESPSLRIVKTTSALSMLEACKAELPADAFVAVAAVADFGNAAPIALNLADDEPFTLSLTQNPDILGTIGHLGSKRPRCVIGFAAETDPEKIVAYAEGKRIKKNADLICANVVGMHAGHGEHENRLIVVSANQEPRHLALMNKTAAAEILSDEIGVLLTQ